MRTGTVKVLLMAQGHGRETGKGWKEAVKEMELVTALGT